METPSHSSDGGYDYQFVDTPLDRVVCVICCLPSRDPYMTECCGHVYCKSCLDNAKAKQYASCSMCKDEHFTTFCNKQINREVRGLHIYCTNKEKGCEWEGEIRDISAHIGSDDGCQFKEVKCPNGCKELVQRHYLPKHIKYECSHREIECQYCHSKVKLLFADGRHLEECPKLPLLCPNGCGKVEIILREDMEAHRKECPLEVIQCEYHSVGCDVRMPRKRQTEHEAQNVEKHLRLTKGELGSTKVELASTKNELGLRVNNLEAMMKILTSSGSTDLATVCSNPTLVASQAKWSMQLAAMEATSLLDEQTCPVIMKFTDLYEFDNDRCDWNRNFFSHKRGYRMKIWVSPDYGPGYVDISTYVMQGPYDEHLRWPLREKFQVTLLNQVTDDEHITVTLTYDDNTPDDVARVLGSDGDDCSEMLECQLIASRDLIKTTPMCAYLKNDCILLKVDKI